MNVVIRALLALLFCLLAGGAQAGTYYPKKGDTLAALARHVKSDVPCLMSLNKGVISDPNRIYVDRPIELGQCDRTAKRVETEKAPTVQASIENDLVWLPSQAMPCTACDPREMLKERFPEDVASMLVALAQEDKGTLIAIDRGERFAMLQLSPEEMRTDVRAVWRKDDTRVASRYAVSAHGMEYVLIRHEFGGWAIKDPSPDYGALARIRDELTTLSGDDKNVGAIELIARLIWWRRMTRAFEGREKERAIALWQTAGLPGKPQPIP